MTAVRARRWSYFVVAAVDRETELALIKGLRLGDADAFDGVASAHFDTPCSRSSCGCSRRGDIAEVLLEGTWL